jgi:hypothetical protein
VKGVRDNGLALFFGAILLAALVGQLLVGHAQFNHEAVAHHGEGISLVRYLTSSAFVTDVMENWQSEYLQFTLYILATVWFLQRGSPESKEMGRQGTGTEADQRIGEFAGPGAPHWARVGGLRTFLFSHSLVIVMTTIWLLSWFAQGFTGHVVYNSDQLEHHEAALTLGQYLTTSDFWDRTLQNWQSEFLAVGSMAVLSIYLRERGSPESKAVGAPHAQTGVEGG